jgi:hypothetical protein
MVADPSDKKPVLLRGKNRTKTLEATIGGVNLQLWDFETADVQPCVRLAFTSCEEANGSTKLELDGADSYIDLDATQADLLAIAIYHWAGSEKSDGPNHNVLSMRLKVGALSMVFHGRHHKQDAHLELCLSRERGTPVTATLSYVEATILGALLKSLIDEEPVPSS